MQNSKLDINSISLPTNIEKSLQFNSVKLFISCETVISVRHNTKLCF